MIVVRVFLFIILHFFLDLESKACIYPKRKSVKVYFPLKLEDLAPLLVPPELTPVS